jgi:RNA polymerase sigma factor (sigma-70 family)
MKRAPTRKELKAIVNRRPTSVPLSLSDLQVPVRPLLTRTEEWRAGRRVRSALHRLERILPHHPRAYRRFVGRMQQALDRGTVLFTWMPMRARMLDDGVTAQAALDEALRLAPRRAKRAIAAFEEGARILATYPLDPETLFNWAKLTADAGSIGEPQLEKFPRFVKIDRIVRRSVDVLERERNRLVLPNLRLVLKEVFRYHPLGMRHSDLFQEGVLGLHKAVLRYDPARATRFSTYATYWIRQSIRKALIDKSRMIRVPQAVQEELRKEEPSLDAAEVDRVRRIMSETMLFSAGESDDEGDRNTFDVKDRHTVLPDESFHTQVIPQKVEQALSALDLRSREVLRRRFGLQGDPPQTLEEIGNSMSLSRERIRQIEREALRRMQTVPGLQEVYEDLGAFESNHPVRN